MLMGWSSYENPVLSRHGVGSGWEMRIGRRQACFLATFNGEHVEVTVELPGASLPGRNPQLICLVRACVHFVLCCVLPCLLAAMYRSARPTVYTCDG